MTLRSRDLAAASDGQKGSPLLSKPPPPRTWSENHLLTFYFLVAGRYPANRVEQLSGVLLSSAQTCGFAEWLTLMPLHDCGQLAVSRR